MTAILIMDDAPESRRFARACCKNMPGAPNFTEAEDADQTMALFDNNRFNLEICYNSWKGKLS
ncbi:MAG: hypothetical protein KGI29_05465 [Pseudomonadota bacterium]|nr:hypothetical protein [Pseudomonadota bacterium]MDE3037510.1 hypothetical protein [Pseudomonadota bacterium]